MDLKNVDTLSHWEKWKDALGGVVNLGEKMGMSKDTIDSIGKKVGDFLTANVDPENREQRVLQELWKSGDDSDRKVLTKMLVNMTKRDTTH